MVRKSRLARRNCVKGCIGVEYRLIEGEVNLYRAVGPEPEARLVQGTFLRDQCLAFSADARVTIDCRCVINDSRFANN